MLDLSMKFHQICFNVFKVIAETRFVTDGRTDIRKDGAILIFHPKFLRKHKIEKFARVNDFPAQAKGNALTII